MNKDDLEQINTTLNILRDDLYKLTGDNDFQESLDLVLSSKADFLLSCIILDKEALKLGFSLPTQNKKVSNEE